MPALRRHLPTALVLAGTLAACGCQHPLIKSLHPANVMHELQPHRLWMKNRHRPPSENQYFFSVPPPRSDRPASILEP